METRYDVAVAGGGITGLVAAWGLQRAGLRVVVLEASARAGGVVSTVRERGFLAERGPNSLLRNPALDRVVSQLGLEEQLVVAGSAGRKRFVVRDRVPHAIPTSPAEMLRSPLLSWPGKLRVLREPWVKAQPSEDETVASFVRRRLGREVLDRLVNPFVAGVYAGDPERLGVAYAFPKLHALEREHGGLVRGMLHARRARRGRAAAPALVADTVSFRDGLDVLPRALAARLGDAVRLETPLRAARHTGEAWRLSIGGIGQTATIEADALVWTAPAHAMRAVEWPADVRDAAATLAEVRYPAVTSMTFGFRREHVAHALDGFGVLVPAVEPLNILGALFTSTLFPGRAPSGHVTITCFIGGARRPELAAAPTEGVRALALSDLQKLLGVRGDPVWAHATTWPQAIPQYDTWHGRARAAAAAMEGAHDGLFVAGQSVEGIALGECIAAGERAADRVGRWRAARGVLEAHEYEHGHEHELEAVDARVGALAPQLRATQAWAAVPSAGTPPPGD